MSAILGLFHLDGRPVSQLELESMSARLLHRGAPVFWRRGSVGLGWIVNSTSRSARADRKLDAVLQNAGAPTATDTRLDNRQELASTLAVPETDHRPSFENRLVEAAYLRWGDQSPEKLIGDFAFAIWDPTKQVLFCARDFPGVRPFYYLFAGSVFAFASEIKPLLALTNNDHELDSLRIVELLTGCCQSKTRTIYQAIRRLPPGASLTVHSAAFRVETFWSPVPVREIRYSHPESYQAAFAEKFEEAVACRLDSESHTAALMSGGLDSTSIAFTAAEFKRSSGGAPLTTVSAVFPGLPEHLRGMVDEAGYIAAAAATGKFQTLLFPADQRGPFEHLDLLLNWLDEPFFIRTLICR